MKYSPLDRRTMLRSLGAATIGLPLLEEMLQWSPSAKAAEANGVPVRAFNLFFGLGIRRRCKKKALKECWSPSSRSSDNS